MTEEKLLRINALAKRKREMGLTEEETAEQQALYKEYLAGFRAQMRGTLENTVIERPDGTRTSLKKEK
jgi:uncharacterized protein YnzC (UPF0291/DUF896 family)